MAREFLSDFRASSVTQMGNPISWIFTSNPKRMAFQSQAIQLCVGNSLLPPYFRSRTFRFPDGNIVNFYRLNICIVSTHGTVENVQANIEEVSLLPKPTQISLPPHSAPKPIILHKNDRIWFYFLSGWSSGKKAYSFKPTEIDGKAADIYRTYLATGMQIECRSESKVNIPMGQTCGISVRVSADNCAPMSALIRISNDPEMPRAEIVEYRLSDPKISIPR